MIFDETTINPKNISPITLAFVGDAVYSLIIREELVLDCDKPADRLHKLSAKKVSAVSQCAAMHAIMDALDEEELAVFKRGRNAATKHSAKHASSKEYHYATGFESLIGYLYLARRYERIRELYRLICEREENTQNE
ncbi:MAG: ribonuclease III [Clostridia bacterium]|nr:ribonuclease III [Clostridia bacterium]